MFHIILADDEEIMRTALLTLIDWSALDCEIVLVARNGQEVIESLDKLHPDIIISDIKMPVKSGLDIAEHIYHHKLSIKVILVTAFSDFDYARQAIRYGVSEYIVKTGAVNDIPKAVERSKQKLFEERKRDSTLQSSLPLFFQSIINGSLYSEKEIYEQNIQLDLQEKSFVMIVATEDFADTSPRKEPWNNSLLSMLKGALPTITFTPISFHESTLTLVAHGKAPFDFKSLHLDMEIFQQLTTTRLLVGISNTMPNPFLLATGFEQANQAVQQSFFPHQQQVFFYQDPKSMDGKLKAELSQSMRHILSAFEKNKKEAYIAAIDVFLELLLSLKNLEQIIEFTQLLFHLLNQNLYQFGAGAPLSEQANQSLETSKKELTHLLNWHEYSNYVCRTLQSLLHHAEHFSTEEGRLVPSAKNFIQQNISSPISLSQVADTLSVNASYLSRLFKEETGQNLIDYTNEKKMAKASQLLRTSSLKIYEVAQQVGMDDAAYFSHLFRRYYEMSPRDYQKKSRRNFGGHYDT